MRALPNLGPKRTQKSWNRDLNANFSALKTPYSINDVLPERLFKQVQLKDSFVFVKKKKHSQVQ